MREILTANRTYYVRTDGNNNNSGLDNTAAGAFLTIQKAANVALNTLDTDGYTVTIQVATGTYAAGASVGRPLVGGGILVFNGDQTTPTNVLISGSSACFFISNSPSPVRITGFKLVATGNTCIYAANGSDVVFGAINFGASGTHLFANQRSTIQAIGNYTVSASSGTHVMSQFQSIAHISNVVVTLTGTPAFASSFANCDHLSYINWSGVTFSGTATGNRYIVDMLSVMFGTSGNMNFLPGNVAFSTGNGALVL